MLFTKKKKHTHTHNTHMHTYTLCSKTEAKNFCCCDQHQWTHSGRSDANQRQLQIPLDAESRQWKRLHLTSAETAVLSDTKRHDVCHVCWWKNQNVFLEWPSIYFSIIDLLTHYEMWRYRDQLKWENNYVWCMVWVILYCLAQGNFPALSCKEWGNIFNKSTVGKLSLTKHSDNMFWKKLQTLRKMTIQLISNK
jgi:hypothetical protein